MLMTLNHFRRCYCSVAKSYMTLCDPMDQPTRLLCPWDFPDKNTGVSCHFLLQGIFLDHGWNPCLLHWQTDSLPLNHQGSTILKLLNVLFLWDLLPINLSKYAANFPAQPNPRAGHNCKDLAPTIVTIKLHHFCRVS